MHKDEDDVTLTINFLGEKPFIYIQLSFACFKPIFF